MRVELLAPGLIVIAANLTAACGPAPAEVPGPRSVLLCTIDTTRADHIGCYGYEFASTPVIDGLADTGVRFAATFSVAPITFPSHVSLLTGTIPPYHGVRDNGSHRAVPELLSLAEILQEESYQTAAFTGAFVLDAQFGLDQGFDVYEGVTHTVISAQGMVEERSANDVNRSATRWLGKLDPQRPFFLWVHYFEPHQPYPDAKNLPTRFRSKPYDAEIHAADKALGQLLRHLESLGRRAETLVVMTSDHGESLGEHGEESHSFFAYQGTLHVPLVISHASLPQGKVIEAKTSLVDVFPTVLELLRLEGPVLPAPGRALNGMIAGDPTEDVPTYFESLNSYLNYGWAPIQGVAIDDYKLIHLPRSELYDWRADAGELKNLYADQPERSAQLLEQLQALLEANEPPERASSPLRELTSADRAALANLGYTGAASDTTPEETMADPKDGIERIRKEESIRALILGGQLEAGGVQLKQLLDEDPQNAIFNSHYGYLQLMLQRPADGIPYLEKSLELGFKTADNYGNLGISYLFIGDPVNAKKAFESSLMVDTKNLTSLFWLARAHAELNQRADAIARLEEFLGLWHGGEDPMVTQAKQLLAELKQS